MSFRKLTFRVQGVAPLLMHAPNGADPLNPFSKAMRSITGKRKKVESDYERLAEIEYKSGLYMGPRGPVLTSDVVLATLTSAAKKTKRGNDAKAGLFVEPPSPLEYEGPRDADGLWGDPYFRPTCGVRVGSSRVMRTRPMFSSWQSEICITFDDQIFNESEIRPLLVRAGEECGFCDWRPRYGRFLVVDAN